MKDLTKGSPLRLILGFAIPLALGNILQLFYSLADTRIVGSTLGDEALTAVGATSSLSNFLMSFLFGLGNGFAIIYARHFGAGNEKRLKKCLAGGYFLTTAIALFLTLVSVGFLPQLLTALNVPAHHMEKASGYIRIILLGMVFTAFYNSMCGALRSVGDSLRPLMFLAVSSVLNIILDYVFIVFLNAGVEGAAIATVISQAVSAALCLLYIRKKYRLLWLSKEELKPERAVFSGLLSSGLSMGLMLSLVNFGTLALQGAINALGDDIIVAHMAARKLTEIFMLPFGVLGSTMATFCSQNLGAGKYSRIRAGLKCAMGIGMVTVTLTIICSYTIVPQLIKLVTDTENTDVIDNATRYLRFDTLFYPVTLAITVFRNTMQGFGDHVTPIISSAIELLGKVMAAYFLAPPLGYFGIILTEPMVWILMVIPLLVRTFMNPVFRAKEDR